ncbi:tripartite tricarboxylate transporter substrate-binding protein [Yanghanlia caeni]|uniref:Tripartite tricarboxylate transporter substrate binding protein n=1 Tax=Yanghanlia caeni TaxID=3064283 RepID=A0ABU1D5N3_9BURK|nr:tripartite tricarboxylate transporter substrate binding protein [Alcaligenaceae bacterium LG-2]NGR06553.1 tripartite tricarboxylate transporter substrate binding protein [bacterium SGD-2]
MKRIFKLGQLAALTMALGFAQTANAAWPDDRVIEVYVGYAAGGTTDMMARTIAPFIAKHLGGKAQLAVINKTGASGELAVGHVQAARPDGYTIGIVNLPGYFFLPMYRKTQYDPEKIQLLGRVVSDPSVMVTRQENEHLSTLEKVNAELKKSPESVSAGHNGLGTNGHLAMKQYEQVAGIQFNAIPYKGTAEQRLALAGGHLDIGFVAASEVQNIANEARPMRLIAQFTRERIASLPDLPTTFESGFNVEMTAERGFAMPKGAPAEIVERLQNAIKAAMADPEYIKAASADAPFLSFLPGDEWEKRIVADREIYKELAKEMEQ